MPSMDVARSRFRLGDDHVVVLFSLATGETPPDEMAPARSELRERGLLNQADELSHLLFPLLQTLISPVVAVSLELAGRQGKLHHGMFIGEDHVVTHEAWPGEAESEYACVEPSMLLWALADMVNLRRTAPAPSPDDVRATVVETTVGTLDAGLSALETMPLTASGHEEREHIRNALAAGGPLDGHTLSTFTDMIAELRSSWRMTAVWQRRPGEPDSVAARAFAVWDCGPLGYWHRESPKEPVEAGQVGPNTPLRLSRVPAARVWELITETLPSAEEARTAVSYV
ncbi:histidine kinase [Streptomyces sp. p1417]|uniref:Histidine kinase n=2 Tax=Streptomyces typhae TaxID=2681492 RepID=A0A6L6WRB3_9ACTN|nr:histidine kinase [Streptomyces typhae]